MKDTNPQDDFIEAEIVDAPSVPQSTPDSSEPGAHPPPEAIPTHEIEIVPAEAAELYRAPEAQSESQPEMLTAHWSAEKRSYTLFDFVLVLFGLIIAIAFGLLGAGIEYGLMSWLTDYQWIAGFSGGIVAACGGMLASTFFISVVSKFLYNRDTDRWKRTKEYPKSWHAVLLVILAIIEPSVMFVVAILAAVGGGIGYGASMNLARPWTAMAIGTAIPIAAGTVALVLIYDFADGGSDI
jgi:hypothetical protein